MNTALARAPSPVFITYVRGENNDINVKRLPKKPAPSRFGRKLTAAQKERATHICVDCGYIYCDPIAFEEVDPDYRCCLIPVNCAHTSGVSLYHCRGEMRLVSGLLFTLEHFVLDVL